jgi:hypothetical protein
MVTLARPPSATAIVAMVRDLLAMLTSADHAGGGGLARDPRVGNTARSPYRSGTARSCEDALTVTGKTRGYSGGRRAPPVA